MYTGATSLPNLYIRNIIPDDMNIPLLGYRTLSGWGYAAFLYRRSRNYCDVSRKAGPVPS
jgi:hypothetical protein